MSKHTEPDRAESFFWVDAMALTSHEAVNLASKLLQFATKAKDAR